MEDKKRYADLMSTDDFELFYYKIIKCKAMGPHFHDFYEIYLFISGEIEYNINGRIYKPLPGDIIVVNTDALHQPITSRQEQQYERYVLRIDRGYLNSLSTRQTNLSLCFSDSGQSSHVFRPAERVGKRLRDLFDMLYNTLSDTAYGGDIKRRLYLCEIVLMINEMQSDAERRPVSDIDVHMNETVIRVFDYIKAHLTEEISLDVLSEHFFISKFYLSHLFKRYAGTTIHKYIIKARLKRSKEYILTGMPIKDVFKHSGFGDYCNYLRAFRLEYGMTPSEYYDMTVNRYNEPHK